MPPRFYVPEAPAQESSLELPRDEAAHLTRVLRLTSGDRIRVFNGRGEEWDAQVDDANKQRVSVRLINRVTPRPEARVPITLCVAALKGDKMDHVVRDAVMLGAVAIQPLVTERTEIAPRTLAKSGRIERWQRIAVASAKQCGRAVVPEISAAIGLDKAIEAATHRVMLVEPGAASTTTPIQELPALSHLSLFVGPEGGWTAREVQCGAESGVMLLTLGALTLRADAVPLVALTACRVHLEDF